MGLRGELLLSAGNEPAPSVSRLRPPHRGDRRLLGRHSTAPFALVAELKFPESRTDKPVCPKKEQADLVSERELPVAGGGDGETPTPRRRDLSGYELRLLCVVRGRHSRGSEALGARVAEGAPRNVGGPPPTSSPPAPSTRSFTNLHGPFRPARSWNGTSITACRWMLTISRTRMTAGDD